jgi:hypothetical protein
MTHFIESPIRPPLDIELALRSVLQRALAGTNVRVDVAFPGVDRLPSVSLVRAGGISVWPHGAVEYPRIDINAWAKHRQQAVNLVGDVLAYLQSLEGDTITFGDARFSLRAVDESAGLTVGQDESTAQGIYRALRTADLTVRQMTYAIGASE